MAVTAGVLLLASFARFAWEARPVPPILPPEKVPDALLDETRRAVAEEERRRTPLGPGERLDPNRDDEVELARLPGIGPAMARRLVESREREGPFRSPEELLRVSGIGPATLDRLRPHLNLDAPPAGALGAERRAGGVPRGPPDASRSGPSAPSTVDVNRADREALMELPGIGPALADRILDHRAKRGPFRDPADLLEVPGIGPATLERLRPLIRAGR